MNINERILATSSTLNNPTSGGATNHSDEPNEPSSTLSIFSLDYKK